LEKDFIAVNPDEHFFPAKQTGVGKWVGRRDEYQSAAQYLKNNSIKVKNTFAFLYVYLAKKGDRWLEKYDIYEIDGKVFIILDLNKCSLQKIATAFRKSRSVNFVSILTTSPSFFEIENSITSVIVDVCSGDFLCELNIKMNADK
jgi:hypothetical protein